MEVPNVTRTNEKVLERQERRRSGEVFFFFAGRGRFLLLLFVWLLLALSCFVGGAAGVKRG